MTSTDPPMFKGGISRVVDMTICLRNPNWNPAHFFGSEHFFCIPNWKSKTPYLESKMESNRFLESEIESSKLSLESKTETVGIQHFFGIQIEIRFKIFRIRRYFWESKI